jgi:hypothetical protein
MQPHSKSTGKDVQDHHLEVLSSRLGGLYEVLIRKTLRERIDLRLGACG